MKTYLSLTNTHPEELPEPFRQDDVRYPPGLVRAFLDEYTRPGDRVLDPFAGFGTTLIAAQAAGRQPYGASWMRPKSSTLALAWNSPLT